MTNFKNDLERLTASQKEYLSKISIGDLLEELKSGKHALRLSSLDIVNKENLSVVKISPPLNSENRTVIGIFDKKGKSRINITDNAQYTAFNELDIKVLSIGSYRDSGKGYLRLYNDSRVTSELGSIESGGYFSAHNSTQLNSTQLNSKKYSLLKRFKG